MHFKSATIALAAAMIAGIRSVQAASIEFLDYNGDASTGILTVTNGACKNMPTDWNDEAYYAYISNAICVFWAGCSGHHTKTETGDKNGLVDFSGVCTSNGQWTSRISSYKCYVGSSYPGGASCT